MDKEETSYIAYFTEAGLYTLRIAIRTLSLKFIAEDSKKKAVHLFELEDGSTLEVVHNSPHKIFVNLDACNEFISSMNRL